MSLPHLSDADAKHEPCCPRGLTLAVYAPFGNDETLSNYPEEVPRPLPQHELVQNLLRVAASGINVSALIDLAGKDSYLVEIPAYRPNELQVRSRWKLDMASPRTLAGFLSRAWRRFQALDMVLALEGHGAGYLPDIDHSKLTPEFLSGPDHIKWTLSQDLSVPTDDNGPVIVEGAPILPKKSPTLPGDPLLSTWALGRALERAQAEGVPKLAVIHLNNCFNMSGELLHTVSPYAHFATGYENYQFYTAGAAYPAVFAKLQSNGTATRAELAAWFGIENRDHLATKPNHPTVGCVVELSRMGGIAKGIDGLCGALIAALQGPPANRPQVVAEIKGAIWRALNLDTNGDMVLDAPDSLTDIGSLAFEIMQGNAELDSVKPAAEALLKLLGGIKLYGASGSPWMKPAQTWNFDEKTLAMNLLLPDPILLGTWDWRSPYYLDKAPDAAGTQPHVIDFLAQTRWVDFIIEYHKGVPFKGLLPARNPLFPVFDPRKRPDPGGGDGGQGGGDPTGGKPNRKPPGATSAN
jgi:hypothetical protein